MSLSPLKSKKIRIVIAFFIIAFIVLSFYTLFMLRKKPADSTHIYASGDLELRVYTDGEYEFSDYVNSDGELTYANDKRYARLVRTYDSENRVISESYYDEFENPVSLNSGYAKFTCEYDGLSVTYRYFDDSNKPVEVSGGYYILVKTISEDSRDYTNYFYDENMNPFVFPAGYSAISYHYDGDILVNYTFLDSEGNPINLTSGYSTVVRTYYEDGRIESEHYLDTDGSPAKTSGGVYGLRVDSYYENGKRERVTYINPQGNPMPCSDGYTTIVYTYYNSGALKTAMYFDSEGNPYKTDKGYYGVLRDGERTYYLNRSGHRIFHIDNLIGNFPAVVVVVSMIAFVLFMVLPKGAKKILLAVYFLFILYETIFFRERGHHEVILNLFASYRGFFKDGSTRLQIIENIWLFIPYGVGIASLMRNKKVIVACFLLPFAVEFTQLIFNIGVFEVADLVNNVLGEIIGLVVVCLWGQYRNRLKMVKAKDDLRKRLRI